MSNRPKAYGSFDGTKKYCKLGQFAGWKGGQSGARPRSSVAPLTFLFFKTTLNRVWIRKSAFFLAAQDASLERGPRSALPTFPTCKFSQLEWPIQ